MADIYWPDSIPNGLLAEGFSKQPQNNVTRTAMDAGPKKARRRYTARTDIYKGKQRFTRWEMEVFENFYHLELADGVLRFMFIDPITLENSEFRFTEPYLAAEFEGYFEVSMSLERL